MATIIDALVTTLRLDASQFKQGSAEAQAALEETSNAATRTGTAMEAGGKRAAGFSQDIKRGAGEAGTYFKQTREDATRTAAAMEAGGKQAAEFFAQIKNEALGLIAVLIGAEGLKDFVAGTTNSLADLGRTARSIGVSPQALSAFSLVMQENGGSAEQARSSLFGLSQQLEYLRLHGNSPILPFLNLIGAQRSDNPFAIFEEYMKFAQQHANDEPLVGQIGAGLGFDQGTIQAVEQIKTLAQYQAELAEASKRAATPAQVQAATELQQQWFQLTQTGQALGRAILLNLDPALISAAKGMTDWLNANKGWLADDITGKVHTLGDDISYAAKQMGDWKSAAVLVAEYFAGPFLAAMLLGLNPVTAAIVAIVAGLKLIDEFKSGSPLATLPTNSPKWKTVPPAEQALFPNSPLMQPFLKSEGLGGSQSSYGWGSSWLNPKTWFGPSGTITGKQQQSNADAISRFFLSQGYSLDQVSGLLANANAESSFNPNAENAGHYGIFQWDQQRQADFLRLFGHPMQQSTLQEQLEFSQWELTHTHAAGGAALRSAQSPGEAARAVAGPGFEGAPGGPSMLMYRSELAGAYARGGMPPGPPPSDYSSPSMSRFWNGYGLSPFFGAASSSAPASTTSIHVGNVTINTKATDAKGIAQRFRQALVDQADQGIS